ncbi:Tm-1-like ATP-binding domain-containing protein [Pacificoceanicola onchidii]|uniref:Tm-1-like ATP-binding domain-containing protein n=1 Tax=Pacificoceanicola onchidii TaxID=2562685 RepID=UPI0010A5AAB5|nr:Tm-1-like ATP-binding domain-containing protein [Pacificoceanicola onchidii]
MAQVLVLATLATKAEEVDFLCEQMQGLGLSVRVVDVSLDASRGVLDGDAKRQAMVAAADKALQTAAQAAQGETELVVGLGGGTGGEIILNVLRGLPITFPKILVTTLPFDPRVAVADNAIIFVPTLVDIAGLNAILREVLENTALMASGLCRKQRKGKPLTAAPSVGITGLGATESAVKPLVDALAAEGRESTVFHSNGYGGAAFARFASNNAFSEIVDLTPHEITRQHVAGAHVEMPDRFSAGGDLRRVVLPGAMNFMGLGPIDQISEAYRARPHYAHSGLFTHVKLTEDEMALVAGKLATHLNALAGPVSAIVPLGGFSHHDRPGGVIEDRALREVCLETLKRDLRPDIPVTPLEAHIFDGAVTREILAHLAAPQT